MTEYHLVPFGIPHGEEDLCQLRLPRCEGGSTHVLEAIVVICIMFTAIASVATIVHPPPGSSELERIYSRRAETRMTIWAEHTLAGGGHCGDSVVLDQLVSDGIAGPAVETSGRATLFTRPRARSHALQWALHPSTAWSWGRPWRDGRLVLDARPRLCRSHASHERSERGGI